MLACATTKIALALVLFSMRTVSFNLAIGALDYFAQLWPPSKVLQVEANIIGLGQVVQVTRVKLQQIHWSHRPKGHHVDGVLIAV